MIKILLFLLIVMAGLWSCASTPGLFDPQHPGTINWAGGEVQLLFSNPEYDTNDPLVRQEVQQREIFGKKSGDPAVTGGIGMMGVWGF